MPLPSSIIRVHGDPLSYSKPNIMKYLSQFTTASCVAAALLLSVSPHAFAAKKKASPAPDSSASVSPAAKASPSPGTKMVRVIPFHGMISAVDARAKTFTIAGKEKVRVFKVTDQSVITKTGSPATVKDLAEKEEVRGSYWKEADGTLMAKTVKLGPPTPQEKAADEARKAKRAEKKAAKAAAAASASASPNASASPKP